MLTIEARLDAVCDVAFDLLLNMPPAHPNASCHVDITTMGRCVRCRKVILATLTLAKEGYIAPERYFGGVSDGKQWSIKKYKVVE